MKSFDGGSTACPGEQAHGQVEGAPPGVDRRGAPAVRGAQRGEHQRGLGRRREVVGHLRGVVGGVLVVLVEGRRPRGLLRPSGRSAPGRRGRRRRPAPRGSRRRRAGRAPAGSRCARPSLCSATAWWRVQVERDDERAGAVGRGQRQGLPPAGGEAQRGVLELRLGRRQTRRPACRAPGCGRAACRRWRCHASYGSATHGRGHGGHDDASVRVCTSSCGSAFRLGRPASPACAPRPRRDVHAGHRASPSRA